MVPKSASEILYTVIGKIISSYFVPGIMLIISTLYHLDLITNIETQGRYFHFAQGDSF